MPPKYTHLSQRNQILKRPGQHIGSTNVDLHDVWLVRNDRIVEEQVPMAPGLLHIFYEVLANAVDNYFNSSGGETPLKRIDITIDPDGRITVRNDGNTISNTLHVWELHEEKIDDKPHYEAEIIFGHLNSSSNYEDTDTARIGGGLHGVGVKLTNIFSRTFTVECLDPVSGIKFYQEYTDNMVSAGEPVITSSKVKKGYTQVSYIADFSRFNVSGYSETDLAIIKKMCIDAAMITGQRIYYNGELLPVKSLVEYAGYYTDTPQIHLSTDVCDVVLCEKNAFDIGLTQISFVNGISTKRGGVHVDAWKRAIFTPLLEKIKAKFAPKTGKGSNPIRLTIKNLENYFMMFVNARLPNPEFDGQTKSVLSSPIPKTDVPITKINALMKWGFVNDIEEGIKMQTMKELTKTDGKKAHSISIPGAEDAIKAGTVKSGECTLFIVEGLSAKTFASKGISSIKNGVNFNGILPIRGKLLNVRGASVEQINNNAEITNIKQILGLQFNVDYSDTANFNKLRYGKVVLLTDADHDGTHIKGLIINFFHYFYPSLLARGYLASIRTPIVKVTQGGKCKSFYYLKTFNEWVETNGGKTYTAKYYKGLGTSIDSEVYQIFANPVTCRFDADEQVDNSVNLVFSKKLADERKKWLGNYKPVDFVYESNNGLELVPITKFLNNEMISFSIYDNKRSIPSLIDGFKPSQRKALWVGLKILNERDDYKVAQFAADVARLSEYHHGETSMCGTIIGMAQTFVGANNITVFHEAGQFGTMQCGGEDAASARYIYTHLTPLARAIFREEDDPILEYLSEEGKSIEPKFFVPIIPLLLANGCAGIGTGYSTNIPSFNPLTLVEWIRIWLDKSVDKVYPPLIPWYRGYTGVVTVDEKNPAKFIHKGVVTADDGVYTITALPIKVWTDSYKMLLDGLKNSAPAEAKKTGYDAMKVAELKDELRARELSTSGAKNELLSRLKTFDKENGVVLKKGAVESGALISKWENHGGAYNINFKVWPRQGVEITPDNPKFGLTCVESTTNMILFTGEDSLRKYESLEDILNEYCEVRLDHYNKRKKYTLEVLQNLLNEQNAKAQFIKDMKADPKLMQQTEDQVFKYLEGKKYYKKDSSYRYLTDMPIRNITTDKYESLIAAANITRSKIEYITSKTPEEMWLIELDNFVDVYKKWDAELNINTQLFTNPTNVKQRK